MGEMRNALLVRAADAVIAIGGGWGTLSEIALAQRIETPVVGLHDAFTSAVDIPRVERPEEAVRWALEQAERRRSEEHTSELQSLAYLVCRLLLEKKKKKIGATVMIV